MKIIFLLAFALFSFTANALNADGSVWEGTGTKATDATTFITEKGDGALHQTIIRFAATPITVTNNAGVALTGGLQIYTFPRGNIEILGAEIRSMNAAALTCSSAGSNTFTSVTALGSVTASNDATLTSTEANILASTASTAAVTKIATVKNITLTAPAAPLDGTVTAIPLFLNVAIANDAANATGTCTLTGFVSVTWANLSNQ